MKPKFTDAHRYQHGYRSALKTNIAETFARIRKQQQANTKNVIPIATPTGNDRSTAASGDAPVVAGVHRRQA